MKTLLKPLVLAAGLAVAGCSQGCAAPPIQVERVDYSIEDAKADIALARDILRWLEVQREISPKVRAQLDSILAAAIPVLEDVAADGALNLRTFIRQVVSAVLNLDVAGAEAALAGAKRE